MGIVFAGRSKATVFPIVKSKDNLRSLCHVDLNCQPKVKVQVGIIITILVDKIHKMLFLVLQESRVPKITQLGRSL